MNVGTSGQVSAGVAHYMDVIDVELRVLTEASYILVGSSLCGGLAYAAMEKFFRATVKDITGLDTGNLYAKMDEILARRGSRPCTLQFHTQFCGTRENPELTGSICGLKLDNFTPEEFLYGILSGIAEELVTFHKSMCAQGAGIPKYLIGSGNAIRFNRHFRNIFENLYHMKMQIPVHREEASYGAALYAMTAAGIYPTLKAAQELITYL